MVSNYYPDVTLANLLPVHVIIDRMIDDPLALERPACSYPAEVVASLRSLWAKMKDKPGGVREPREVADGTQSLDEELTTLLSDLRSLSVRIAPDDTKDQLNYFRTATALIAKLTDLQERAANVKQIMQFHKRVLGVFDEVLTPEQRTQALRALEQ